MYRRFGFRSLVLRLGLVGFRSRASRASRGWDDIVSGCLDVGFEIVRVDRIVERVVRGFGYFDSSECMT